MKKNLIVCYHFGRCGSTLLSSSLDQNPKIESSSEIFTLLNDRGANLMKMSLQDALGTVQMYLDACRKENLFIEIKAMNFLASNKCKLLKLHKQIAHFFDAKTLYLRRENVLGRLVSSDKASQQGIYHAKSDGSIENPKKQFHFNLSEGYDYDARLYYTDIVDRIRCNIDLENRLVERFKKDANDYMEISYEKNLFSEEKLEACVIDLCNWLELEYVPFVTKFRRTSAGLENDLVNYEALVKALTGQPYSHML